MGHPGDASVPTSSMQTARLGQATACSRAGREPGCLSSGRSPSRRQLGQRGKHLLAEWGIGRRQPQWQPWKGQFRGLGEERGQGELTCFHGPHSRLCAPVVAWLVPKGPGGRLCYTALRRPCSSEATPAQPCHGQGKVAPQGPSSAGRSDHRSAGSAASSNAPHLTGGVPALREGRGLSELAQQPRSRAGPLTCSPSPGFATRP